MVQKFPGIPEKARKLNTSEGITFFPKTFHRHELFHLNSPRNYRVFRTNGKRSRALSGYVCRQNTNPRLLDQTYSSVLVTVVSTIKRCAY